MTLTDEDILEILKVDLQVSSSALDLYLLVLITSARAYIAQEGITLADTAQDAMLYAITRRPGRPTRSDVLQTLKALDAASAPRS